MQEESLSITVDDKSDFSGGLIKIEDELFIIKPKQQEVIMNSNNPLFLPEGSVRAILAFLLIGGTVYATISGINTGTEVLYTLTGGVLAHYFNARGKIGNKGDG